MIDLDVTGFINLRLTTADGQKVEKEVDLFSFYNRLVAAGEADGRAGRHADAAEKRAAWLKEQGFDVTPTVATLLVNRLEQECSEVQKKSLSNGSAATAGSTGSPSGPTPPAGGSPPA